MKSPSRPDHKAYLGDSVYVRLEYGQIVLSLNNGDGDHSTIYLEPEIWQALVQWQAGLGHRAPANDRGAG